MRSLHGHLPIFAPYVLIAVWSAAAIYISIQNPAVGLSDMFGFIPRAESLSFRSLSPWVNGLYPLGYPLALKWLSLLTGDYVVAGRIISLLCAIVSLVLVARLGGHLFGSSVALAAVMVCVTNPVFMTFATISSTDMPAAALLLLGVYWACRFNPTGRLWLLFAAGAAIGAAYLIRYTALTVVPAILLFFWIEPEGSWRSRLKRSAVFALGFLVAAAPQLVLSALAQGNPFYNLQARNVYFGMFGHRNWGHNMPAARSMGHLSEIVVQHPVLFLRHWFRNLLQVPSLNLIQFPLNLLAYGGLLFSLRHRRSRNQVLLLILVLVAFTAAVCMAFPSSRLLLFPTLILSLTAGYACIAFIPARLRLAFPRMLPLRTVVLVGLGLWLAWHHARPAILHPLSNHDRDRIKVSRILASHGADRACSVLSLSFDYYDVTKRTKDLYALTWYETDFEPYQSVEDLAERMRRAGQRFLVFDNSAPRNVRGLESIWPFDESHMAERFEHISTLSGSIKVYRLRDLPDNPIESDR
jgi:hypothetical protein